MAKKNKKTLYLDTIKRKARIEKQKRSIFRFYVFISTLLIVVTIIMIAINPSRYFNMVVILLLAAVVLIAIENIQLRKLKSQKPQHL